jgi:hypothetical protein
MVVTLTPSLHSRHALTAPQRLPGRIGRGGVACRGGRRLAIDDVGMVKWRDTELRNRITDRCV